MIAGPTRLKLFNESLDHWGGRGVFVRFLERVPGCIEELQCFVVVARARPFPEGQS